MSNDIESIGVAFDTSGLEKGAEALQQVQAQATKTTDAVDKLTDSVEKQTASTTTTAQKVTKAQSDVNAAFRQTALAGKAMAQTQIEISDAAQKLMDRYDPLGTKLRKLTSDMAMFRKEMGDSTLPGAIKTFEGLEAEIEKTVNLMDQAGVGAEAGFGRAANAANKSAFATASARRELIILGREVMVGNWSRVPSSFMVMAERTDLLSRLMSPLAAGLGIGAIAVGALVAAMVVGHNEIEKFNNQITLTGGYSGQTAGSMDVLAAASARAANVGIGKAREALMDLNATGRVSSAQLGEFGDLILRQHEMTGQKLEDLAKDYAKMSEGVVKWAVDHNESMHFMSLAQYEHIKLLEEQGNKTQAMVEVTTMLEDHFETQKEQVGTLTSLWNGLARAVSSAIDAMKNMGKPETVEDRLAEANGQVALARNPLTGRAALGQGRAPDLETALEQQGIAQSDLLQQRREAAHTAEMAHINEEGIAAQKWADEELKRLDKKYAKQKEYDAASRQFAAAQAAADAGQGPAISSADQQKILDDIDKKYEEHTKKISQAKTEYQLLEEELKKRIAVGQLELEQGDKLTAADKLRAETLVKVAGFHKQLTKAQMDEVQAQLLQIKTQETQNDERTRANKQLEEDNKNRQHDLDSIAKQTKTLEDQIAVQRDHNATIGMGKDAIAELTAQREEDKASMLQAAAIKKLDRDLDFEAYDATMKEVNAMRQLAALKRDGGVMQQQFDDYQKSQKSMWESIDKTAHDVWVNIFDGGSNAFKKLAQTLKSTLLDLLYQMVVRKWVVNIVAQVTGDNSTNVMRMLGGNGTNSMSNGLGNNFGMLGNVSNLYSVGSQYLGGSMSGANAIGTLAGNASTIGSGTALDGLLATNGAYGTAAAGAGSTVLAGGGLAGVGTLEAGGAATFGIVDAGAVGGGLAAGAGAGAGAAGIGGAAAAGLAAIPVAGWIALAAIALYSMFGGKKHGPKTEGNYLPYDTTGAGAYYGSGTGAAGDQAKSGALALQTQYDAMNAALGGSGQEQIGLGFSVDSKGTAPTMVTAGVGNATEGAQQAFTNNNVGRDDQSLQAAIADMGARAVLAGLQKSNIDGILGDYLKALGDVTTKSTDEVNAAIARLTKASTEKQQLDETWFQLTHTEAENTAHQREQELAALDISNQAQQVRIFNLQDEISLQQQAQQAYADAANAIDSMSKSISSFLDKLATSAEGLGSPQDQLAAAKSQFERQLALAKSGNIDAMNSITDYADQYIQAQTKYTASNPETQAVIQTVKAALANLTTMNAQDFVVKAVQDGAFLLNATMQELIAKADANSAAQIAAITQKASDQNAAIAAQTAAQAAAKAAADQAAAAQKAASPLNNGWTITESGWTWIGQGPAPGIDPNHLFTGGAGAGGGPTYQPEQAASGAVFTDSVVTRPTSFLASATGGQWEMGEAGAEAAMPLTRTRNGKLGVHLDTSGGNSGMVSELRRLRTQVDRLTAVVAAAGVETSQGLSAIVKISKVSAKAVALKSSEVKRG